MMKSDKAAGEYIRRRICDLGPGGDQDAKLGQAAREICAAERPEVTREAVEDFIKSQVRPSGDLDCYWKWAFEGAWRALSHFAPPREARPIDGMSVDEIHKAMLDAWGDYSPDEAETIRECARVAHRLAQPVPVVDPDAEARTEYQTWCALTPSVQWPAWDDLTADGKNVWRRAVASAKRESQ